MPKRSVKFSSFESSRVRIDCQVSRSPCRRIWLNIVQFVCHVLMIHVLYACAPRQSATIIERRVITQAEQDDQIGGQLVRIVQPGDTLYSIAFDLGLDVNQIAAWNGISDTHSLKIGQRIRLTKPIGFRYPISVAHRKPQKNIIFNEPLQADDKPALGATDNEAKGAKEPANLGKTSVAKVDQKPKKKNQNNDRPSVTLNAPIEHWVWPLRGTLVTRFDLSKGKQGLDIQGQHSQTIKAVAAGEVVYAGDSLKGYGNLIIIKHSPEYLSAYAHNQSILVQEGQRIEQSQQIATLGYNLKGIAALQFQIRKNGNPVDPLLFLK